jgi:hypothetical protein
VPFISLSGYLHGIIGGTIFGAIGVRGHGVVLRGIRGINLSHVLVLFSLHLALVVVRHVLGLDTSHYQNRLKHMVRADECSKHRCIEYE